MPRTLPDDLPEGYYLDDFEYLLEFVSERYSHLLNDDEIQFRDSFGRLDQEARRLYVRLSNRKGPYFRADKLKYAEIHDLEAAIDSLAQAHLLERTPPEPGDATALCSRDELLQLEQFADLPKNTRRSDLVQALNQDCNPVEALKLPVVCQLGLDHLMVFRLLFFGNFHQDMTEFVLHELVTPFEQYDLTGTASFFENRAVIENLLELQALSDLSHEVIEVDETGDLIVTLAEQLPPRSSQAMLARRHDRTVNRLARQLERLGRESEALSLYEKSQRVPARERRARLLEKSGKPLEALTICDSITARAMDEAEYEFALSFGHRTAKRHCLSTNLPESNRGKPRASAITIPRSHDRVEQCAVDYYSDEGHTSFYVENVLFRGLFGLCFWDIIFSPVPGAFFHPFQRGPADLYTTDFVPGRSTAIQQRLSELTDQRRIEQLVLGCFNEKHGIANYFVNWQWLSESLLTLAVERIPPDHLTGIFDRLLLDLKGNGSGFPDLILFPPQGYRLIEIKGPGDKIQKNQERWFRHFDALGVPAELVNVTYCERSCDE